MIQPKPPPVAIADVLDEQPTSNDFMELTTMPTNPTESDLETAFDAALGPYFKQDCVTAEFESEHGSFVLELGAFDEELPFNIAGLSGDIDSTDFTEATDHDVIESGDGYCMLSPSSETAGDLVADAMAVAKAVDAELVGIDPRTIDTLPDWWPELLTP